MAKVEIDKIRLGYSELTRTIYAYIPSKTNPGNMIHKVDVTDDFERLREGVNNWERKKDREQRLPHTRKKNG